MKIKKKIESVVDDYGHTLVVGDRVYYVKRNAGCSELARGYVAGFYNSNLVIVSRTKGEDPDCILNYRCTVKNVVKDMEALDESRCMMSLEVGDKVEVMNVWSRHMGSVGKILEMKESKSPILHCRVALEDEAAEQWFADVELKKKV